MRKKNNTSFYIDVETTDNAKLYCKYNNISLSEVINDLLTKWSKKHKSEIDIYLKKQIDVDKIVDEIMKKDYI